MQQTGKIHRQFKYAALTLCFFGCVFNLFGQFRLTGPDFSKVYLTGEPVRIEWTGASQYNVSLYYSRDEGLHWQLISEGITDDHYNWHIPVINPLSLRVKAVNELKKMPYLIYEINNAHDQEIRSVNVSPGQDFILSSSPDGRARLWDIKDGRLVAELNVRVNNETVNYSDFIHNSDSILVTAGNRLVFWNHKTGDTEFFSDDSIKNVIRAVAVNPVGEYFAVASNTGPGIDDGVAAVYSLVSKQRVADFRYDDLSQIRDVTFSPDGTFLAFCGYNGKIDVYDWRNNVRIASLSGHGQQGGSRLIYSCRFSPDGRYIVSGGGDQTVRLWDYRKSKELWSVKAHDSQVWSVDYNPDGRSVLSASLDDFIRQWDAVTGAWLHAPLNHGGSVLDACYSPDGSLIVSAGRDNSVKVWRNIQYLRDSSEKAINIKYPAVAILPHIKGKPGQVFRIPFLLKKDDIIPATVSGFDIKAEIEIPSDMMEVLSDVEHSGAYIPKDTIVVYGRNLNFNDTVDIIRSEILFSEIKKDDLKILGFEIIGNDDYAVTKIDGTLEILDECIGDQERYVVRRGTQGINLYPNPVKNELNLSINIIEEGDCRLFIADSRGLPVRLLFEGYVKPGIYDKKFFLQNMANGLYSVVMTTDNFTITKSFIIVN